MGGVYLFLPHLIFQNLVKMQIPLEGTQEFSLYLLSFVWRQWEFAFFGALTTVGALFILKGERK